ncbi:MAG: hypothetical protein J6V55_06805 [Alistipes sp.]|nr:hypothetical protein [Alistipes sp.]
MHSYLWNKLWPILHILLLASGTCYANEAKFKQARQQQREGKYDSAISAYKEYLATPLDEDNITDEELFLYTEALTQLMNTYQSKGDTEGCIVALQEVFDLSPILQKQCIRDYYSVLGYALSRTERMAEAEMTMLRALSMTLHRATPERYFRDYAYAAAIFYSNPDYQSEVINWCEEALHQAELSENSNGAQYVKTLLGSIYKRNGHLNSALNLFNQSKDEAQRRNDDLGVLNSLHALTDLFLYWNIPEYANRYATEAVKVEKRMKAQNPMISAQTYINKGRTLQQLGEQDSVTFYTEQARRLCQTLPYNSGMVDVDLLSGSYLTDRGGDSVQYGIEELIRVTKQGTTTNRAKAYHQLAQTYLQYGEESMAESALDSLYALLNYGGTPIYIRLEYEPILNHYQRSNDHQRYQQFTQLMLQEQNIFNEKSLRYNTVESIVNLHTIKKNQELKLAHLKERHHSQWLLVSILISLAIIATIVSSLHRQKRAHRIQMKKANEKFSILHQELKQTNAEKEKITSEINEFLNDNNNRQEMETLTPFILKESGEVKFRQCFEILYPLFLHRLREKVPAITRREELLSMLIALKQNNKEISELLAIAPRSVLMLRHRFRQKIGMSTELSLENFIEELLGVQQSEKPQNKDN